eukprot:COSAG02_NODE_111_length_36009_cov_42.221248_6_plen_500_part_00
MQLHYSRGTPPPIDSTALALAATAGRPRLQRFDDAKECGSDEVVATVGRLVKISVWARSDGSIDAIACRSDRGINETDGSVPRYVEHAHSSGTRPGRTSRVQHLTLRRGEQVVCISGHMGMRRLLRLQLRTSHRRSLEWGLEKREAELEGGRSWSSTLPLGVGWHLAGFAGALRAQEGIIQLAPIWARDDSLTGAFGPNTSVVDKARDDWDRAESVHSEDDIARYDDRTLSPLSDATAAAAAAVALQRAFGLIGCLAHPTVDSAAGFPPLAVHQFIEWIGGEGHPNVLLFTRALAQLLHPEPHDTQGGYGYHRFLPQTILEDEMHSEEREHGNSAPVVLSPTDPVTVTEWIAALWSASQSDHPAGEVRVSAEWLLLAAAEADATHIFPSHTNRHAGCHFSSSSSQRRRSSSERNLDGPDSYMSRPQSAPPERRQTPHRRWAHGSLYASNVLTARRKKRDGFGGGSSGAALREGILSQLASKASIQRALGHGCESTQCYS